MNEEDSTTHIRTKESLKQKQREMGSNSKSSVPSSPQHHAVLFPFMAQGHTIPLLQFAHLLLRRNIAVTVITIAQNRPFISTYLNNTTASIITIPFPQNIPQIPNGVENTDKLPSVSLLYPFAKATKLMQSDFEQRIQNLLPSRVTFIVSDSFLWWTLESANKFGVPRLVFSALGCYSTSVLMSVGPLLHTVEKDDELITVPDFPWIKIKRNDFHRDFLKQGKDPEFMGASIVTTEQSYGMIVNSFYELESVFVDHLNRLAKPKVWCVGPLCLADSLVNGKQGRPKHDWIQWLDRKLEQGCSVLYVAFGSQADVSDEQLKEIAKGLEELEVNFLWVVRNKETKLDGFEERVKNRGIVVREWVEQREILYHESVKGFLSHCGSSSLLESICACVPILGWPLMADQSLIAKLVEEIKVGFRVKTSDGSLTGFVNKEELVKSVKELMEGEKGKERRKKVKEFAEMANRAMEENRGSSWKTLDKLIWEISNGKQDGD